MSRVQELFLAALKIPAPERKVWLTAACAGDERLLRNVSSLLDHDQSHADQLDAGIAGVVAKDDIARAMNGVTTTQEVTGERFLDMVDQDSRNPSSNAIAR